MSLKKIKEKNPGFDFSDKATKKASDEVLQNSLKSKLTIESYNIKYSDEVSLNKDSIDVTQKKHRDDKWTFLKKINRNENTDSVQEPKASMFNEEGEEIAAED